jgi:hypothetical protein
MAGVDCENDVPVASSFVIYFCQTISLNRTSHLKPITLRFKDYKTFNSTEAEVSPRRGRSEGSRLPVADA